jgi:hypothetical protein
MANPVTNPATFPRFPHKPRYPRASRVAIAAILALFLGTCVFGFWIASCAELPTPARFLGAVLAIGIAALFTRAAWLAIDRKRKTGHWAISAEERQKLARPRPYPAWLRVFPSRLRNEPNDPLGMKFITIAIWAPAASGLIAVVILRHAHGLSLFFPGMFAVLTIHSAWDLYRTPKHQPQASAVSQS